MSTGKGVLWTLYNIFGDVAKMRGELREMGQSEEDIAAATERMVRHHCQPEVPDEHSWPDWLVRPRCAYCSDTGLVLRFRVRDKLGQLVTVGSPCRCAKGARFEPAAAKAQDFTEAGKSKKKPMTRFGS